MNHERGGNLVSKIIKVAYSAMNATVETTVWMHLPVNRVLMLCIYFLTTKIPQPTRICIIEFENISHFSSNSIPNVCWNVGTHNI